MAEIIITTDQNTADDPISQGSIFDDTEQRSRVKKYFDQDENWKGEIYKTSNDTHAQGVRRRIKYIFEMMEDLDCFNGSTAIDIGCGPGEYINELINRNCRTTGIDLSTQMLGVCRKKFQNREENITGLLCSDVLSLPFRSETFNIVICVGVLQYVISVSEAINELSRVMVSNGIIVICFENILSPSNFGFYFLNKVKSMLSSSHSAFSDNKSEDRGIFSKWFLSHVSVPHLYKLYNPHSIEKIMEEKGFRKINSRTYGYSLRTLRRVKIFSEKLIDELEIKLEMFFHKYRIPYLSGSGEFYIGIFSKN